MSFCTECGTKVKESEKFCTGCGSSLQVDEGKPCCSNCGAELLEDQNFCTECGCSLKAKKKEIPVSLKPSKKRLSAWILIPIIVVALGVAVFFLGSEIKEIAVGKIDAVVEMVTGKSLNLASGEDEDEKQKDVHVQTDMDSSSGESEEAASSPVRRETEANEVGSSKPTSLTPAPMGSVERALALSQEASNRKLKESEFDGFSKWELDVMRNAIYARHGRTFKRQDLQSFFDSLSWYLSNPLYSDAFLTVMEQTNAQLILDYQKRTGKL